MNDTMVQEESINMSNEQAVQILIPMRNMMCDRYGCPISDAVFALDKAIEALSTDRPQKWIPCSERLPKRDELVLVTYKTTDRIHLCRYLDDGSENPWWSYIDDCCAYNNVVIAWMPLPKPYREDGEE